jgi:Ser/Thr protein kinase RdoA (MazF antagonist)
MRRRDSWADEWVLVDGDVTIVGDVVLRPAHPWTPTVHALLSHLRAQGLTCVPEPIAVRDGVEALTHLPGDSGGEAWRHQVTDDGVRSAARLLREVHDATRGWEPPRDAEWAFPPVPGADVICHGDPGPWNMVWRDGEAVGLFDWDLAHPAPALDDVAYALEYFTPFRSDDHACDDRDGHSFPEPPDRRARLRSFAAAYGLGTTSGLVDRVIARQAATVEHCSDLAERGVQPQKSWVEEGYLDELRGRVRWSREHRQLFD